MDVFAEKVAVITGGASGIGRAIAQELVRRGARVVLADINGELALRTAQEIGSDANAAAVTLDVRDAAAVQLIVNDTASRYGRLDYMFNNAGIAIMGEARDMSLADWNDLLEVNLRGVMNGVAFAYPLMVRQGFGHIVNTASAAGLMPTPGATGYAMTKHAVVGLSTSLRAEAAGFGVKVSVVCPGFIDTPIKYSTKLLNIDREAVLENFPLKMHPAEKCARDALLGVERNQAIIVVTGAAKIMWRLYRLAPGLLSRLVQFGATRSPLLDRRR